ncbi:MAG: hypothetical protein HC888_13765 [Candidatus Competibacteraceae bacterium]|nr:hypothetical protein [Candidatus Competibacteraceae bacterium]
MDLNGHTMGSRQRVLAMRPAPVQVNWLGFPGSAGSPFHHYIIADDFIIPPDHEHYYSERVLRLPCYQANQRHRAVTTQAPSRSEAGLPEDGIVYCSFNSIHKATLFTWRRWLEILGRVPGSVLWLLATTDEAKTNVRSLAAENGIDPARLIFADRVANPVHMARLGLADLFLDSTPYGAHTTGSDALWAGVPVLTLSGRSFASRVCGSLVRSAGIPDLICTSPRDYVERAVELGRNRARCTEYRQILLACRDRSVLFDTPLPGFPSRNIFTTRCGATGGKGSFRHPISPIWTSISTSAWRSIAMRWRWRPWTNSKNSMRMPWPSGMPTARSPRPEIVARGPAIIRELRGSSGSGRGLALCPHRVQIRRCKAGGRAPIIVKEKVHRDVDRLEQIVDQRRHHEKPLAGEPVKPRDVFDEDGIGPDDLAHTGVDVAVHDQGSDHPAHRGKEPVEEKTVLPQEHIHFSEQRLIDVHGHEFDFGLDHGRGTKPVDAVAERHQFGALDIEFEKIDTGGLGDVIKPDRIHQFGPQHAAHSGKPWKRSSTAGFGLSSDVMPGALQKCSV